MPSMPGPPVWSLLLTTLLCFQGSVSPQGLCICCLSPKCFLTSTHPPSPLIHVQILLILEIIIQELLTFKSPDTMLSAFYRFFYLTLPTPSEIGGLF